MTDETLEDTYPHWRDALFGNHNAVANIRCAVHYVFWHSVYALIALLGIVILGSIKLAKTISNKLESGEGPVTAVLNSLTSAFTTFINHDYTKKVGDVVFELLVLASLLYVGGGFIYLLYTEFWVGIKILALVSGLIVLPVVGFLLIDKCIELLSGVSGFVANYTASKARVAGEKAVKTPGIRRVYGECPVDMDMAPKWFADLFPEEDH